MKKESNKEKMWEKPRKKTKDNNLLNALPQNFKQMKLSVIARFRSHFQESQAHLILNK